MGMKDLINKPHFTAGGGGGELPPDPAIPARIKVCLDNVVAYAGNPRQSRNPAYDELKDSIRSVGLNFPPNVTRANPADPYMIRDGGNTRLEILRELWHETGDRKFYEFECMFHPYTDDLDILIKHMIENEVRGGMILIERGLAALKAKQYFESKESRTLSNAALARELKQLGWTIDDKSLGIALYASQQLLEVIPKALWSGLGIDSIQKIRKVIDDCRKFWVRLPEHAADPEEAEAEFELIWTESLAAQDHEDFSVDAAQNALEDSIAGYINCPVSSVRGEIQAMSRGLSQGGVKPVSVLDQPGANPKLLEPVKPKLEPETRSPTPGHLKPKTTPVTQELSAAKTPPPEPSHVLVDPVEWAVQQSQQEVFAQQSGNPLSAPDDERQATVISSDFIPSYSDPSHYADWSLVELQRRSFELVREYFSLLDMQHFVRDTADMGYGGHLGFCMTEPPYEVKNIMETTPTLGAIYQQFTLLGASPASQLATPGLNIEWLASWGDAQSCLLRSLDMQALHNYAMPGTIESRALEVLHSVEIIAKAIVGRINSAYEQGA